MPGPCPLCGSIAAANPCPACPEALQAAHDRLIQERAPVLGTLPTDEASCLKFIQGLRGHSNEEKVLLILAYRQYAEILEASGREPEALRMASRAKAIRDSASVQLKKIERREASYSFIKDIRQEEGENAARVEAARRQLEATLAWEEKRNKALRLAGFGLAGFLGGSISGYVSPIAGAAAGLGAGAVLQQGSRLFAKR
jgi:hypothetical protein